MRNTENTSVRPKAAYALRAAGLPWSEIARRVGYTDGKSALTSVQSWRATHHLPNPAPPRDRLEESA